MPNFFQKIADGGEEREVKHDPVDLSPMRPERERTPRRTSIPKDDESEENRIELTAHEENSTSPEDEGELTVDIYDKGDSIVIQSTVAGVKPDDLDVAITNDTVTIRGRREQQEEVEEENYYYKELFWGGFSRTVILPEEVEEDMAEAVLKHGLLTIRLPKKKRGVVQKLKVRVT